MIILGLVLLVIGLVAKVTILWTIGIILVIAGGVVDPGIDGAPGSRPSALLVARRRATR